MKAFYGYIRTLYRYWQTTKGRHDIADYGRALFLFFVLTCLALLAARFIGEFVF